VTRLVVDASARAALVFEESQGDAVRQRLDGATVFVPELLRFELANTAWKKVRRQPPRRSRGTHEPSSSAFRYTSQRVIASRNPASGSRVGMNSCAT